MSGVVTGKARQKRGPLTFQVFQTVVAGQLVVPGTAGNAALVGVAGAGANNCLGVATTSGLVAGTAYTGTSSVSGYPFVEAQIPDENIAVDGHGIYALNALGTIANGDPIKCGATGGVLKWVSGTDAADLKIGRCVDALGGTNGGAVICDINIS